MKKTYILKQTFDVDISTSGFFEHEKPQVNYTEFNSLDDLLHYLKTNIRDWDDKVFDYTDVQQYCENLGFEIFARMI